MSEIKKCCDNCVLPCLKGAKIRTILLHDSVYCDNYQAPKQKKKIKLYAYFVEDGSDLSLKSWQMQWFNYKLDNQNKLFHRHISEDKEIEVEDE